MAHLITVPLSIFCQAKLRESIIDYNGTVRGALTVIYILPWQPLSEPRKAGFKQWLPWYVVYIIFLLQDFVLPDNVALPVGGVDSSYPYVVMQLHYDNPNGISGKRYIY